MSELKQTDLSKRLREAADSHPGWRSPLTDAANEIDKYYNGMLYWKAMAEAQSRTQPEATNPAQADERCPIVHGGSVEVAHMIAIAKATGLFGMATITDIKNYSIALLNEFAAPPAQDLSEAVEILDSLIESVRKHGNYTKEGTLTILGQLKQCLASPADALVAGDRVDAERYRHLRELMQFSTPPNKPTTMKLRAALPAPEHQPHRDWMGEHFDASVDRTVDADIRACLTAEEIPEFDASRAAIQAQKDGHG